MALRVEWQSEAQTAPLAPLVLLSLAAHLGAAVLAAVAPYVLPRRIPQAPIIVVDLVSLPEGGAGPLEAPRGTPPPPARRKEEAAPPAPQAKPQPKAKKPEAVKLPEPGKAKPAKDASEKKEPAPAPAPAPAAAAPPLPPAAEPGPAPGVGGAGPPGLGEQPGGGIGSLDAETFEFAWYRAALTQRLRASWLKPSLGELGAPLRTVVYFKVMRDGRIVDIQLETPSGLDALDRSALRAVYDANPLPPLPYAYKGESLGVHFFFELVPE